MGTNPEVHNPNPNPNPNPDVFGQDSIKELQGSDLSSTDNSELLVRLKLMKDRWKTLEPLQDSVEVSGLGSGPGLE